MPQAIHLKPDWNHPVCTYLHDIEFTRRRSSLFPQLPPSLSLKMQMLMPAKAFIPDAKPLSLVIFVNGGGYHNPQMYARIPWQARLAELGYVVAVPQYRGTEDGAVFPDMIQDIRTAIRYLRSHAEQFCIDPERIVLMGGSAGGHIALLSAYGTNTNFDAPDDDLSISASVRGVIDLYGPTDITVQFSDSLHELDAAKSPWGRLFGTIDPRNHPDIVAPSIVSNYISKERELPPTLIAHGNLDTIVSYRSSALLYHALQTAGQDVTFYCMDGAGHADNSFFSNRMMKLYADFIDRVTK